MKTYLPCKIFRGEFSSERVYEVLADHTEIVGVANEQYVLNERWQPAKNPSGIETHLILGYVECRVIQRNSRMSLVELPCIHPMSNGKQVEVWNEDLIERP